jgi:hypothetical protein
VCVRVCVCACKGQRDRQTSRWTDILCYECVRVALLASFISLVCATDGRKLIFRTPFSTWSTTLATTSPRCVAVLYHALSLFLSVSRCVFLLLILFLFILSPLSPISFLSQKVYELINYAALESKKGKKDKEQKVGGESERNGA